ncbi:AAA family ATPase [Xylophilus sp. GW821-FHT01B05]
MRDALDVLDELLPDQAPPQRPRHKAKPSTPAADPVASERTAVSDGVVLLCGSSITPQPIAWLWPGWLAEGKFHVLAGAPGQGKTTIAITLAATITMGGYFPDGTRCAQGNVLIWSGEDDPADTLLPRLIAAGGNPARIYFVAGSQVQGDIVPFDPARDMIQLMAAVDRIGGVRLLIVDPVVSAVAGDSHKNTEVRRALQPLVDLASLTGAAVLGISHFSKGGQGQDPTQRVVGSIAFSAVARVVLVAAKVKTVEGEDRRILARSKSNIGPDDGGFEYHLEQIEALPGIQASRVAWGASVAGSARDLLAEPDDGEDAGESAGDAAALLREALEGDGWHPAKEANKVLTDAGFTKKQIWNASKKLAVIRRKGAMKEGWYWRLPGGNAPEDSLEDSEHSTFRNVESTEPSRESSGEDMPTEANLSTTSAHVGHSQNVDKLDNMAKLDNLPPTAAPSEESF